MTRQSRREAGRRSQIQANLKDRLCNRMHRGKERASSSLECWQEEKKELRLFADDGLAAEEGKIFPEERVEFRDLARSIMFAFSSLVWSGHGRLLPSTKTHEEQGQEAACEVEKLGSRSITFQQNLFPKHS